MVADEEVLTKLIVLLPIVPACTSLVGDLPLDATGSDTSALPVRKPAPPLEIGPEVPCLREGTPGVFTDERETLGITFTHIGGKAEGSRMAGKRPSGGGVAAGDLDGDGAADLFFSNGDGPDEVYLTGGRGALHFERTVLPWTPGESHLGAFLADFDRDGDLDVLTTPPGATGALLVNDGHAGFTRRDAATAPLPSDTEFSAAWGDANADGWPDLLCAGGPRRGGAFGAGGPERLFLGGAGGDFTQVPVPTYAPEGQAFIAAFVDVDNDADQDVYVVNDQGMSAQPNELMLNDGTGALTDASEPSEANVATWGMGLATGDYDGDGWTDLYVTSMKPLDDVLLRNRGDGTFEDVTVPAHAGTMDASTGVSWGALFTDVDSDGDLDLYVAHGFHPAFSKAAGCAEPCPNNPDQQPNVLLVNSGGAFTDGSKASGTDGAAASRSPVEADLDGDGFPDLVVGNLNAAPYVYLNHCAPDRAWLGVRLRPTRATALGARVTVEAAGGQHGREIGSGSTGYLGGGPPEVAIGLGGASKVDRLEVVWVGGERQEWTDVPVRRWVTVHQAP